MLHPEVSVVICTRNRADILQTTLDGVLAQTAPAESFEILVVDNGSTDNTRQIIHPYEVSGQIRAINELRLGLNYARNSGWKHAKGDYIAYLDDDAIPKPDWLVVILNCLHRYPGIRILGGAVIPVWSLPKPNWLEPELYPALSICDYNGLADGFQLDFPRQYPVGANIIYQKCLLAELGGFDPNFDRMGSSLLSGGETELNFRGQALGNPVWYCPTAVVHHHILPVRICRAFFRNRYYWSGRTWALLQTARHGRRYAFLQMLERLVKGLSIDLVRYTYFGLVKKRNLLLTEVYYRELFGYCYQVAELFLRNPLQSQVTDIPKRPA